MIQPPCLRFKSSGREKMERNGTETLSATELKEGEGAADIFASVAPNLILFILYLS